MVLLRQMKPIQYAGSNGFTLIELLVVLSVIILLTIGVLSAVFNARKEARDLARVNTAEQLKLGIRLFKEAGGAYPNNPTAAQIVVGSALYNSLAPFLPTINADPLGGAGFGFWYDSSFTCAGATERVILVRQMEFADNSNFVRQCGATAASGLPSGFDSSKVYVQVIN